jgi:hypothetical protein
VPEKECAMANKKGRKKIGFDTSKRSKRGGQQDNVNALRHGFYSRTFTEDELVEIGRLAVADLSLDEEIAMLRVLMRRVLEADLSAAEVIELFGRATGQLRRLVETKMELESGGDSEDTVSRAMERALDELAEELGVEL